MEPISISYAETIAREINMTDLGGGEVSFIIGFLVTSFLIIIFPLIYEYIRVRREERAWKERINQLHVGSIPITQMENLIREKARLRNKGTFFKRPDEKKIDEEVELEMMKKGFCYKCKSSKVEHSAKGLPMEDEGIDLGGTYTCKRCYHSVEH